MSGKLRIVVVDVFPVFVAGVDETDSRLVNERKALTREVSCNSVPELIRLDVKVHNEDQVFVIE